MTIPLRVYYKFGHLHACLTKLHVAGTPRLGKMNYTSATIYPHGKVSVIPESLSRSGFLQPTQSHILLGEIAAGVAVLHEGGIEVPGFRFPDDTR